MAVDGTPEAPIAATRVASAAEPPAAAPAPAAAAPALEPAAAAAAPVTVEPAAAPAAAAVELVTERPSLLESFGKDGKPADKPAAASDKPVAAPDKPKDEAVKPADAKPADPAKPAEAAKPADPAKPEGEVKAIEAAKPDALAPIEYQYELPPTLKMDDALKGEVHTAFDAFRADPSKGAQALIDLHTKVVTDMAAQNAAETLKNQHKAFNDTRSNWNKDWLGDAQIGGAGYQTATRAIARMRDMFVSDETPGTPKYQADLKSFEDFLRITGAGDHPAFGRFLHNVARAFDEPSLPPANPKPVPQKPPAGRKADALYTHPSSQKAS